MGRWVCVDSRAAANMSSASVPFIGWVTAESQLFHGGGWASRLCMVQMHRRRAEVEVLVPQVGNSWGILSANAHGDSLHAGLIPFQLGTLYVIHKANKWADFIMF